MSIFKKLFSGKQKVDKDSSRLIFNLYYKTAYQSAYFYCGDKEISEEAAQEAIFKAIQNLEQLRDKDKIEAWIKRIAINNVNSIMSKHKKVVSLEQLAPIADSIENSPEYVVNSKDLEKAINKAIDSLDPAMKQVIHLYYYEEMKVKDISTLIERPEGTVKTLLHRARAHIKNRLIKEGYVISKQEGGLKVE